ncbi:MAG: tyrosine-type recombinase/integrase [Labilithrix sp.]|nr:tyrosine-type recombinase/integrase [Labilithrix sp.]
MLKIMPHASAPVEASYDDEKKTTEPRGAESAGTFKVGGQSGNWRLYPVKKNGVDAGHILHVWVKPNTWKKAKLPREPETSTPRARERWCKEAAPAIFKAWHEEASKAKAETGPEKKPSDISFFDFAKLWTNGELHEQYPDHVKKKKKSSEDDAGRFEWMKGLIGDVALRDFTLDHAERIMRAVPRERSASTRRRYAQSIHKVLALAVYPCRLLEAHPLPKGFLPRVGPGKAKNYLRPDEDATLLGCTKETDDGFPIVPLARRVYWGFLSREGMREGEPIELRWSDVDLEVGGITLDENKSDDPRSWAGDPGVIAALKAWREVHPLRANDGKDPPPRDARVFVTEDGLPLDAAHLPRTLRADLLAAGVERPELHTTTNARMRLRVHDLRGTFVTIALANGATESWIADRTGHKSSAMINRYKRTARTVMELGLGKLRPMIDTIPELAALKPREPSRPAIRASRRANLSLNLSPDLSLGREPRGRTRLT